MARFTTLNTFILHTPKDVFSVELFGSWDNFDRPYHLFRDKRAGRGQWRGCHSFENITCDGDLSDLGLKRDGALKMGGTYWYFYRLNGVVDYHNPNEPVTTTCPSLPGQPVNVLDVPVQTKGRDTSTSNGSTTSLDSAVFTLNPSDRYVPLDVKRAATMSVIQQGKTPMNGDRRRANEHSGFCDDHDQIQPGTASSIYDGPGLQRQGPLQSPSDEIRRAASVNLSGKAGSSWRTGTSWSRKLFSRARSARRKKAEEDVPEVPKITHDKLQKAWDSMLPKRNESSSSCKHNAGNACALSQPLDKPADNVQSASSAFDSFGQLTSALPPATDERHDPNERPLPSRDSRNSKAASYAPSTRSPQEATDDSDPEDRKPYTDKLDRRRPEEILTNAETDGGTESIHGAHEYDDDTKHETEESSYAESAALSHITSEYFSPCLTSNTTISRRMSSTVMSQPETPRMAGSDDSAVVWQRESDPHLDSDCPAEIARLQDDSVRSPTSPLKLPSAETPNRLIGFQGYSLPHREQTSTVTIKKPSSDGHRPPMPSPLPLPRQTSAQLVQSWDDGAQHRIAALSEMMGDLGYLGKLIN